MANVLVFHNLYEEGQTLASTPRQSSLHRYVNVGPGRWRVNAYGKTRHMTLCDMFRYLMGCVVLWRRWLKHDVLIVDGCVVGLMVAFLSLLRKGHRRLIIDNWNVPRHRTGFWKWFAGIIYRRVDLFVVHSTYDVGLTSKLYNIPEARFAFRPYTRDVPARGEPDGSYLFDDGRPFILSLGGNARDYGTFFRAMEGTNLSAIVVAREYNLKGLSVPENVRTFCNIPLEECDKLVWRCMYTVFTLDGSEPSCGQISIVTSLMAGKPVICTDCVGVRDYLSDGVNGMLVGQGDVAGLREKMLTLASDSELYGRVSAGAGKWCTQNASLSSVHQQTDELVTRVMTARPR